MEDISVPVGGGGRVKTRKFFVFHFFFFFFFLHEIETPHLESILKESFFFFIKAILKFSKCSNAFGCLRACSDPIECVRIFQSCVFSRKKNFPLIEFCEDGTDSYCFPFHYHHEREVTSVNGPQCIFGCYKRRMNLRDENDSAFLWCLCARCFGYLVGVITPRAIGVLEQGKRLRLARWFLCHLLQMLGRGGRTAALEPSYTANAKGKKDFRETDSEVRARTQRAASGNGVFKAGGPRCEMGKRIKSRVNPEEG